jgi:8-oxo-dGTP pyrophosphatase MutT (NUDIX family)
MDQFKKTEFSLTIEHLRSALHSDEDALLDGTRQQAAVTLLLRNHTGLAELLMIKRALNPKDFWSGHLALPGGRRQLEDADLKTTAIRETREEVGIDIYDGGEILGRLDTVVPVSTRIPDITITPYVAISPPYYHSKHIDSGDTPLNINHEVALAFWIPVAFLKKDGRSSAVSHLIEGHKYEWPAYASIHGPVWGLTERILTQFLSLLG